MIDLIFEVALSNVFFAMLLAALAALVGAKSGKPHLAHLLWILVLVKLVTPPIVTLPVKNVDDSRTAETTTSEYQPMTGSEVSVTSELIITSVATENSSLNSLHGFWQNAKYWIAGVWLLGSAIVFGSSVIHVGRFHRLLLSQSKRAPDDVQCVALELSQKLSLNSTPEILYTKASIAPMVWWVGGKVRVVIPDSLLNELEPKEWRWVLAHELAHVRRRDYLVRWLEWLAGVCFWWNPLMWWAQRQLRVSEEVCCDALVLSGLQPKPQTYATSIFRAVETLAVPAFRPPALASEINSGGNLERRFKMILSKSINEKSPSWLRGLVLASTVAILPLGLATADENDYSAIEKRLSRAVKKGDITEVQAERMMAVLKEGKVEREEEVKVVKRRLRGREEAEEEKTERWVEVRKKIAEAVRSGEMTREEAAKKMRAMRDKAMKLTEEQRGQVRARLKAAREKIEAAIESGDLTKEEAKEKLRALRERAGNALAGKDGDREVDVAGEIEERMANLRKRLAAAVESGGLTEEEAKEKWEEIAETAKERGKKMKEGMKKMSERIKAAVKEGKITEEEAKEKWEAIREKAGE